MDGGDEKPQAAVEVDSLVAYGELVAVDGQLSDDPARSGAGCSANGSNERRRSAASFSAHLRQSIRVFR